MSKLQAEHDKEITLKNESELLSRAWVNNSYIKAATANNTRRAYRSDIHHFENWGGVLPSTPEGISLYLQHFAVTLNPRTLLRRLTAIKNWHNYQGFPNPTAHPAIQKMMLGILRIHGKPKDKAPPLSPKDLLKIVNKLKTDGSVQAIRDNALIQIGYFGSLRRSELVNILYENINWVEEGVEILLPHSKTDQFHDGQTVAIPFGNDLLCPVTALKKWCEVISIKAGAIFCSIKKGNNITVNALSELSVNHILKKRAYEVGMQNADELSSHSLRRGFTTYAYLAGARIETLLRQGRWRKTDTLIEYIETVERFKDNAGKNIFNNIEES